MPRLITVLSSSPSSTSEQDTDYKTSRKAYEDAQQLILSTAESFVPLLPLILKGPVIERGGGVGDASTHRLRNNDLCTLA